MKGIIIIRPMLRDIVVRYDERIVQDGRSCRKVCNIEKFQSLKDAEEFCNSNKIEISDVFNVGKEIPAVDSRAIREGMQKLF